mmetsp:Transcript_22454/g.55348  ORF Transcript_22454/g.55348 Transcript_22454/m.55348 type:complete len:207 (-) Transcript_22454:443-1063(-)
MTMLCVCLMDRGHEGAFIYMCVCVCVSSSSLVHFVTTDKSTGVSGKKTKAFLSMTLHRSILENNGASPSAEGLTVDCTSASVDRVRWQPMRPAWMGVTAFCTARKPVPSRAAMCSIMIILPPGRNTLDASRKTCGGSSTEQRVKLQTTASNDPSGNGRASAFPSMTSRVTPCSAALRFIVSASLKLTLRLSRPVTRRPPVRSAISV